MNGNSIILEDLERITTSGIDWQRFNGRNILITGASGFLATYMVKSLLYALETGKVHNCRVYALTRNSELSAERFQPFRESPGLIFLEQDVCDPVRIGEPLHFIIHAASFASPRYYGSDPVGTLKPNITGTINLLELAAINPVESFLFFSSSEVYGVSGNGLQKTGESDYGYLDPVSVRSCYAESKRMGENICISYGHQHGIPVKIVRPFHTYGPGMLPNDGRVHADFVEDVVSQRDIVMKSEGLAKRAFCYIADATEAFFLVLLRGDDGQPYNVGNPNGEISIVELAELLAGLYPGKKLKVIRREPDPGGYLRSVVPGILPDISKIRQLGWTPETGLEKGFFRTIASYGDTR